MRRRVRWVGLWTALCIGLGAGARAADPVVWFGPAGDTPDYISMFTDETLWTHARRAVQVFKFGPHQVDGVDRKSYSRYADLRAADVFRKLDRWGIAIAIEVPAVKEWDCTTERARAATKSYIRNVHEAGGTVRFLAIDSPIVSGLDTCHLSLETIAARTASYAKALLADPEVRQWAPDLAIGDIDPYPSRSADLLMRWVSLLNENGYRLPFFHLDVDSFDVAVREARGTGLNSVADLRRLRDFFRSQNIPFGVIIWSGHDPEPSDASYYRHAMQWAQRVHAAIDAPDQIVVQSWVRRSAARCVGATACNRENRLTCDPTDPPYCGRQSVPLALPEAGADVYSHTRLVNDAVALFRQAR